MDQQKLRALVFEKTGVKIDIDDPIFALVALNEAVLAEAVERHVALLDDATADLADQADALLAAGSGCRYGAAERPVQALLKAPAAAGPSAQERRIMAIAGAAAVLCALLVLAGQALLFQPSAQAVRKAEKLEKIVQKLDPETRNAILAEMQKP
jgi:putative intracellular protease/amidase